MADQFTVTSNKNYFQRLIGSVVGVIFGLILFIIALFLLFWNEGNFVRNAKKLDEGRRAVVTLNDTTVNPANEGKLVYLSGDAKADGPSTDTETGFSHTTLNMSRYVEMYQWNEDSRSTSNESIGGSETTKTTYTYNKDWFGHVKDSSRFKSPEGHQNPTTMPIETKNQIATANVSLGDFELSDKLILNLPTTRLSLEGEEAPLLKGTVATGNYFYMSKDPKSPQIGDTRISYHSAEPGTYSIVAKQNGSMLVPYPTKVGKELYLIGAGTKTADELFSASEESNSKLTWILRGIGFGAMFFGFMLILGPLSMILAFMPFLKNLVGGFAGLVALIVSLLVSSAVIAFAWLFYRPLIAIGLLALASLIAFAIKKFILDKLPAKPKVPNTNTSNQQNPTLRTVIPTTSNPAINPPMTSPAPAAVINPSPTQQSVQAPLANQTQPISVAPQSPPANVTPTVTLVQPDDSTPPDSSQSR